MAEVPKARRIENNFENNSGIPYNIDTARYAGIFKNWARSETVSVQLRYSLSTNLGFSLDHDWISKIPFYYKTETILSIKF